MNTDMPLSSTMTSNGPDSDLLLEQLLCEAVVLNSSPETSQLHPQYQSSLLLPNGAPQAHTAGGYIPVPAGSNGVGVLPSVFLLMQLLIAPKSRTF